jgi:hypothetical protein
MSEMVERVARALFVDRYPDERWPPEARQADDYRGHARAAIEAMRAPTDAMCLAGWQAGTGVFGKDSQNPNIYRRSANSWEAMIDAALKEPAIP